MTYNILVSDLSQFWFLHNTLRRNGPLPGHTTHVRIFHFFTLLYFLIHLLDENLGETQEEGSGCQKPFQCDSVAQLLSFRLSAQ